MSLVQAEMRRLVAQMRRDPFQFWFGKLVVVLFFFAYRLMPPSMIGGTGSHGGEPVGTIESYLIFVAIVSGLGFAPRQLEMDINTGAIERLLLSKFGLMRIVAARSVVGGVQSLIMLSVLMVALRFCGVPIALHLTTALAMATGLILGAVLGCGLSGLSLLFRPIGLLALPINVALMVAIAAKVGHPDPTGWDLLMPGAPSADIALGGLAIGHAALSSLLLAALQIAAICGLVALVFPRLERLAKRRGSLGLR